MSEASFDEESWRSQSYMLGTESVHKLIMKWNTFPWRMVLPTQIPMIVMTEAYASIERLHSLSSTTRYVVAIFWSMYITY